LNAQSSPGDSPDKQGEWELLTGTFQAPLSRSPPESSHVRLV
jgi:hypothetical protein